VRFATVTGFGALLDVLGAGATGIAAGAAIGAIDAFFLEGLVHGWTPSTFVSKVNALVDRGR
jgi:hypothetical protein